MKRTLYSALAAACLCLAPAAFAADEQQPGPVLDVTELPPPVQATLKKEGARVSKVEREAEGGKAFYEATLSKGGKNYLLHVADNGKILKRETAKDEQ